MIDLESNIEDITTSKPLTIQLISMNMKVSMKFSLFSLKRMVGKYFFRINKKILVWGVILGRIKPATI